MPSWETSTVPNTADSSQTVDTPVSPSRPPLVASALSGPAPGPSVPAHARPLAGTDDSCSGYLRDWQSSRSSSRIGRFCCDVRYMATTTLLLVFMLQPPAIQRPLSEQKKKKTTPVPCRYTCAPSLPACHENDAKLVENSVHSVHTNRAPMSGCTLETPQQACILSVRVDFVSSLNPPPPDKKNRRRFHPDKPDGENNSANKNTTRAHESSLVLLVS